MITKHLRDCIQYMPKGRWFEHYEVPTPVRRNRWVCDRLREEGVLESKVEWAKDNHLPIRFRTDWHIIRFYKLKPEYESH